MDILEIDNFLSIKRAKLELKRINIFIGPQASGKSIISKLISFCKEVPGGVFESVIEDKSKREFDGSLKTKFESIFPLYTWDKSEFSVCYSTDNLNVLIRHQRVGGKFKFCIEYSESLKKSLAAARKVKQRYAQEGDEVGLTSRARSNMLREMREAIAITIFPERPLVEQVYYIPAGRSFFANLQKNVFSFISSSIPIDHFLKEFGALYERTRDPNFYRYADQYRPKSVQRLVKELLCGDYLAEKGQDWILNDHGKVNVSNSSSGQQEVLPMALVLSTWPYVNSSIFRRSFIIEEPEAHLFPVAQGQIASLIASAYSAGSLDGTFTITTHSPYILTAMNNLIQAGNVYERAAQLGEQDRLLKIIPKEQVIDFSDVAAYSVGRGTAKSILDTENCLISAGAIDSVSEHFASRFEALVNLEIDLESRSDLS